MKSNLLLIILSLLIIGFLLIISLKRNIYNQQEVKMEPTIPVSSLKLESPAFSNNQQIPKDYTCEGKNINPPLKINGIPKGTKSLVLIIEDPDAPVGIWDHWVVWNIPPDTSEIKEDSLPQGSVLGKNGWGEVKYGGPCPPPGPTHHYIFKLYALNTLLDLPTGSSKKEVEQKMVGYILGKAELIGLYQKS